MEPLWFCLLAWMLATYVVLDGFDLGAGILHLFVATNEWERRQVIDSVGPVWNGNEVWLIAATGTMFLAFPKLLAVALSGLYLPLMIVVWLLIFRALGIELRHQLGDRLWTQFWDVAFAGSSLLIAICLGLALGNIVRGVPLKQDGIFFEPLWTDFQLGPDTGILDWYTLLVALTATLALTHHGALWLHSRTDEGVAERAGRLAGRLWPFVCVGVFVTTLATVRVQPNLTESLAARPWGLAFPALALAGLVGARLLCTRGRAALAFLASGAFLYGLLASAAIGIYPYVLPARDPALGMTLYDAAAAKPGLAMGLSWWIPGILLACGYLAYMYATLPAKFRVRHKVDH